MYTVYIGSKEIDNCVETDGDFHVLFSDESECTISKKLYDLIVSETPREGGVTDAVRHYFATEFVARLAEVGLEFYMAEHVAEGIRTLTHNLREKAIGEKFGCVSPMDIKLSQIIPE